MASAPSTTNTVKTINNKTGVTTSTSVVKSAGSTTTTKTTTIGAAKTVSKPSTTSTTKAAGTALDSRWITGPNTDGWVMCGPVAVANCLLAATGVQATNADIERLYWLAGGRGDSGVPFGAVISAAKRHGLAGERVEQADWDYGYPVRWPRRPHLALMQVNGISDLHTAALVNDSQDAVMWGAAIPLTDLNATVFEAWSLTWHGQEGM